MRNFPPIARASLRWRGQYDFNDPSFYEPGDVVSFEGSAYILSEPLEDPFPAPPAAPWELFAEKGLDSLGEGHVIVDGVGNDWPMRPRLHFVGDLFDVSDDGVDTTVVELKPPPPPSTEELENVVGATIPFLELAYTAQGAAGTTPPEGAVDKGGIVHLRGIIVASGGGEQHVADLAGLLRPDRTVRYPVATIAGVVTSARIEPDGKLYLNVASGTSVHLDGINFASAIAFGGVGPGVAPAYGVSFFAGVPALEVYGGVVVAGAVRGTDAPESAAVFTMPVEGSGHGWSGEAGTWKIIGGAGVGTTGVADITVASFTGTLTMSVDFGRSFDGSTVELQIAGRIEL